jgi:hypothetical protein
MRKVRNIPIPVAGSSGFFITVVELEGSTIPIPKAPCSSLWRQLLESLLLHNFILLILSVKCVFAEVKPRQLPVSAVTLCHKATRQHHHIFKP